MEIHQGGIACKIIIRSINPKVGIGNGGARHVERVNDFLEVRGRTIRRDVVGENDGKLDGGRKAKRTAYLTKKINKSHDQRSNHMTVKQTIGNRSKKIMERLIENRSKNDHGTTDRKPI